LQAIERFHESQPLAAGIRKALLPELTGAEQAVVDGLLDRLRAAGSIEFLDGGRVHLAAFEPRLNDSQRRWRDAILEIVARDPWQTPRSTEFPTLVGAVQRETDELLSLLED